MTVVYLTILVSIVILLPCSICDTGCPAAGIEGCKCNGDLIECFSYTGDDIPLFSKSTEVYRKVSYIYIYIYIYI